MNYRLSILAVGSKVCTVLFELAIVVFRRNSFVTLKSQFRRLRSLRGVAIAPNLVGTYDLFGCTQQFLTSGYNYESCKNLLKLVDYFLPLLFLFDFLQRNQSIITCSTNIRNGISPQWISFSNANYLYLWILDGVNGALPATSNTYNGSVCSHVKSYLAKSMKFREDDEFYCYHYWKWYSVISSKESLNKAKQLINF